MNHSKNKKVALKIIRKLKKINDRLIYLAKNLVLCHDKLYNYSIKKYFSRWKMAASYKKLFKLLIDREMKSKDLAEKAGISPATLAKMKKDGADAVVMYIHWGDEYDKR